MSHDNYSLSARVYNHIRDGILAGTFAKGDELKEKNIGDELGVSRTPVREALRQLELEGLVSIIPNKGAFVEGVSTDDIRDIYEIREVFLNPFGVLFLHLPIPMVVIWCWGLRKRMGALCPMV